MKRVISLLLALVLVFALPACGDKQYDKKDEKELDFKSVKHIKTGKIISLGDSKKEIDRLFGKPTYAGYSRKVVTGEKYDYFEKEDSIIRITYNDFGKATRIMANERAKEFDFSDMSFEQKTSDTPYGFTLSYISDENDLNYIRIYTALGQPAESLEDPNAEYYAVMSFGGDEWMSRTIVDLDER